MKDSEVAFLTLNWFFRSQRRSFCIAFILNNLYLAHCLFSYVSLGKHWIMRKFEEYLINVRLKANLDQLVVMHAILMIWNFKGKRIVTSFLFCFVFFFKEKKKLVIAAIVQRYCSKVGYSFCWIFFWPLSLPFNSLSEEPKVEKNKLFLVFTFISVA